MRIDTPKRQCAGRPRPARGNPRGFPPRAALLFGRAPSTRSASTPDRLVSVFGFHEGSSIGVGVHEIGVHVWTGSGARQNSKPCTDSDCSTVPVSKGRPATPDRRNLMKSGAFGATARLQMSRAPGPVVYRLTPRNTSSWSCTPSCRRPSTRSSAARTGNRSDRCTPPRRSTTPSSRRRSCRSTNRSCRPGTRPHRLCNRRHRRRHPHPHHHHHHHRHHHRHHPCPPRRSRRPRIRCRRLHRHRQRRR